MTEARFCALEVGVWNPDLTSLSTGALGVQQSDDVRGASEEAIVLTHGSLVGGDALADTMSPVHGLLDHDHLVLPALRLKCLQLTEFFQLTYACTRSSVSIPVQGNRRGSNVSMVHSSRNMLDSPRIRDVCIR